MDARTKQEIITDLAQGWVEGSTEADWISLPDDLQDQIWDAAKALYRYLKATYVTLDQVHPESMLRIER